MKRKQNSHLIKPIFILCVCMFAFGGCGTVLPDLKDSDMEIVTDYAARKLLEYDTNTPSRLVPEEELLKKEEKDREIQKKKEEREKKRQELAQKVEAEREKNENEQNQQGDPENPSAPEVEYSRDLKTMNAVLGLDPALELRYVGCSVEKQYPLNDNLGFDGVNAESGASLLVMYFDLINTSDESKVVSLGSSKAFFQVKVDDGGKMNVNLCPFLIDDLSSYTGTVEPIGGEVPRLVLIRDYPSEKLLNFSQILLIAKNGDQSVTVKLQ